MLVADPQAFERVAFLAECMTGSHGEAASSGPIPMDLGVIHDNANGNSNNPALKAPGATISKAQVGKI